MYFSKVGALLLAATACLGTCSHAAQERTAPRPKGKDKEAQPVWTVTIETSGGFAGRGAGGITVSSTGDASVTAPGRTGGAGRATDPATAPGQKPDADGCRYTVPPDLLKRLAEAVTKARPSTWATSYVRPENPRGCCDQFRYDLTVEVGKPGVTSPARTFWYDDSAALRPADLREVYEAATSVKSNAPAGCGGLKIG